MTMLLSSIEAAVLLRFTSASTMVSFGAAAS